MAVVRIVDEDSKIALNNAGRSSFGARDVGRQLMGLIGGPQFDPLFESRSESGEYSTRFDVCSAIIDWVDANQDIENCDSTSQAQSMGTEDSFYRNLPDPYQRKNAALAASGLIPPAGPAGPCGPPSPFGPAGPCGPTSPRGPAGP